MDQTTILGLLVVATALNSAALLILAIATVRTRSSTDRSAPARGPILVGASPDAAPPQAMAAPSISAAQTPTAAPTQAPTPGPIVRSVGPARSPEAAADPDPLAGAISAFLTRSDGLFRSGGPPVEPARSAPTGAPPSGAPEPDRPGGSPTSPMSMPASASPSGPGVVPTRPIRHVASAPQPIASRPTSEPAQLPAAPIVRAVVPALPSVHAYAGAGHTPASVPTASRVSVWFVGRDATRSTVQPGAVARLGPVIGGLLRERTRAEDEVQVQGGGRFAVTLPDTPVDGAAALTRRLAESCDAWLAAEEPPLRLEFGMTELPGDPGRPGGRRSIAAV